MKRAGPIILVALIFLFPKFTGAFPNVEVLGTSDANPPFDYDVTSTLTGFLLTTDRRLVISYSDTLKLVDLGTYALEAVQPPALSTTAGTDGRIAAIAYISGRNEILAAQEDGDLLNFDLDNVSHDPSSTTIAKDKKLGALTVDENTNTAYISDNTTKAIYAVDLSTGLIKTTFSLAVMSQSSFLVTDAVFVPAVRESYFTTDVGRVFYIASDVLGRIDVDTTGAKTLSSVAPFVSGDYIYVVDSTTPAVVKISTATHSVIRNDIDISENPGATDVVITSIVNPSGVYAYVGGEATPGGGVSVINTANDEVLDMGTDTETPGEPIPVSSAPALLAASSSTDGYVYMGFTTGKMGIISANPFVTFSSITYSDGGTALKAGVSATIVFLSDQTGTYVLKAGGDQTGSGTTLIDSSGSTSGSITADTSTSVTINYDDNVSAFTEGANTLWGFVTTSPNTGRRATTINVDTPPPNVVIQSSGFGTNRIYVTFDRINVSDMSTYQIYVDTDPAAVMTKTEVAANVAQASSGSTQTAAVDGLTNGTTYYIAMQATDAAGNISPSRTNTFANGSVALGVPEQTVGPAGLLGEKGCSLVREDGAVSWWFMVEMMFVMAVIWVVRIRLGIRLRKNCHSCESRNPVQLNSLDSRLRGNDRPFPANITFLILLCMILISFFSANLHAQQAKVEEKSLPSVDVGYRESPQMWSIEVKSGFWLPGNAVLKSFFTNCCNMITRIEGGLLYKKRYGVEVGAGFLYKSAAAVGAGSGTVSGDRFNFILVPVETNAVWRADYFDWRYLVPFLRAGLDYVYFREGDRGKTTQGVKFGMHGGGGVGLNITEFGDTRMYMDSDTGINDLILTFEAQYQWINNFGGGGLDLSGGVYSVGLLFEF